MSRKRANKQVAYRRRREDKPIPERVHGTLNGFDNYLCKCDACRLAKKWANQKRDWRRYEREAILRRLRGR